MAEETQPLEQELEVGTNEADALKLNHIIRKIA